MTDQITGRVSADESAWPTTDRDSDEEIAERHFKLRGSHSLRYYPPDAACQALCGLGDNDMGSKGSAKWCDHQCYLEPQHEDDCCFSSECGVSVARRVGYAD